MGRTKKATIGFLVGGALVVGGLTACGPDNTVKPAPSSTAPSKAAPKAKPPAKQSERADLVRFAVDDRSAYGVNDVWLSYTITNHSSKKSNYLIEWEAVNSKGVRVANSTEFVTDVLPGQTIKDAAPTTITDPSVKLNITSFDRTQGY